MGNSARTTSSVLTGILVGFSATLLFPHLAEANVPLVPAALLAGFSIMSAFRTSGLALAAVVLIEGLILRKTVSLGLTQALRLSLLANLFSTLIGFGILVTYSSSQTWFFGLFIGSYIMTRLSLSLCRRAGYLPKFTQRSELFSWVVFFIFVALGVLVGVLGFLTIPGHSMMPMRLHFTDTSETLTAVVAAIGLLSIGFIATLVAEGFLLSCHIPTYPNILLGLLPMNIVSYLVLLLTSTPHIWTTIHEKSWFWHR